MRCVLGTCAASAWAAVQGAALKPSARFPGLAGPLLGKGPQKKDRSPPCKNPKGAGILCQGGLSKACPGTPSSSSGPCAWFPLPGGSAGGLEEGEKSPSTACEGQEHPTTAPPALGTLQVPERGVLLLGLGLHGLLGRLAHGEGEGAVDVLGVAQFVQVLPEDLGTLHSHLIIEGNLQQLRGQAEGRLRGVAVCLAPWGEGEQQSSSGPSPGPGPAQQRPPWARARQGAPRLPPVPVIWCHTRPFWDVPRDVPRAQGQAARGRQHSAWCSPPRAALSP